MLLPAHLVDVLIGQGLVVAAILLLEGVRGLHAVVKMRFGGCRGNQTGIGQGQDSRGPGKGTGVVPIAGGIVIHLVPQSQSKQTGKDQLLDQLNWLNIYMQSYIEEFSDLTSFIFARCSSLKITYPTE